MKIIVLTLIFLIILIGCANNSISYTPCNFGDYWQETQGDSLAY